MPRCLLPLLCAVALWGSACAGAESVHAGEQPHTARPGAVPGSYGNSAAGARQLKSYAVDQDKLAAAAQELRRHFAGRSDVRIAVDPHSSQLYFMGSAPEHHRLAEWLASWAQSTVRRAVATEVPGRSARDRRVQVVDHQGPQQDASADRTPSAGVVVENAHEAVRHGQMLQQLGFDVDIEILPDLDAIVLRGRESEVERIAEIIREIERIAKLAAPEIKIVSLRHVRGEAVVELIEEVQTDLTQGRQGRATVKNIGTPNAVLLLGWGEALAAVEELIRKLDLPVDPAKQLRIFHLKHATAAQALTVVDQYLSGRVGLGPAAKTVADARTNALIVHAAPRDLAEVALLIKELDQSRGAAVSRVRVFDLQHTLAADLADTLQAAIEAAQGGAGGRSSALELITVDPSGGRAGAQLVQSGLLDTVQVTPNAQTNSLVVAGPAASMDLIAALIQRLDQPTSTAQIKVFRIVNGDANSLVLMLRALLPTQSGGTPRPQLPTAEGESSLVPIRFAVEQRTNSIIATGSAGDLRIVEALLLRLDENDMQRRQNTVYRLKNAPAVNVTAAINDFLRGERIVQQAVPGDESSIELLEREVVVVAEPVSNSLIISAAPRFHKEIIRIIEDLDAQPPQVLIQVLIAQVELSDTDEFGVELGLQDSVLFDRSLLGDIITTVDSTAASTDQGVITTTNELIRSATNVPGFLFNETGPLGNSGSQQALTASNSVAPQGIVNFNVGRLNNELGFGGLVLSASSESVSVLIRALQESRRLDVLSRPQVMTLDNQPAFVQVGERVPRIVATSLNTFGQTNSIELDNVGLILGVTPRVSPDGTVVMEVDAEKSELGPESEGIPVSVSAEGTILRSPRIDITTAQTTVSAATGETIVLGGLITRREFDQHRRVPLLADVPLLGDLFRYDLVQSLRAELLIILTPHVILGAADAERHKRIESARMHWVAADVHEMHGDAGICSRGDCPVCESGVPVIYPDLNPRGTVRPHEQLSPVPADELELPPLRELPPPPIP